MSVKRFFSTSSREAIKQVRAELGDEAVILSNREVNGGVEVIASAPDDIAALIERTPAIAKQTVVEPKSTSSMPTIARIAHAAQAKLARATASVTTKRTQPEANVFKPGQAPATESFAHFVQRSVDSRAARAEPAKAPAVSPSQVLPVVTHTPAVVAPETAARQDPDSRIMAEILQATSILQEQMGVLSWRESALRRPLQAKQISLMLSAGFSPALARALADKLPVDYNEAQAERWLQDNLSRNLPVSSAKGDMVDRGGVYALVGPTGVGKTTTAAKLAARCVVKYGAKSLGLITVDSYRIGAEDQLRAYGKILGVTVHTARDAQTLADLIAMMHDKHLVLIDTVGMGQRDSRLIEQLQMLSSPSIERVLFLNASAQGETLDDVVNLYSGHGHRRISKVIVSKIDEAVKYGFVLDCMIRHKLEMQYMTNGQRVPEDMHPANAQYLVHRALKHRAVAAFALEDTEIPLVLSTAAAAKPAAKAATRV